MTKRISHYFQDYATYHRTPGNKICHYIGIPMIVISLLGLLSSWVIAPIPLSLSLSETGFFRVDAGVILVIASFVWYLYLDWKLAATFVSAILACYFAGRTVAMPVLWTVFVLGWILQFVGHYVYEKKSPAFFKNFEHLLIGPLWVFSNWIHYK